MNTADSDEMAQPLRARGLLATSSIKDADVVIMNTCTVREQAEHRAQSNIGRLKEWKAADSQRILIVAGCAASLWGESIKDRFPFIDLVSPATKIEDFPDAVARVLNERWNWALETDVAFAGDGASGHRGVGASEIKAGTAPTLPISDAPTPEVSDTPTHPFLFGDQKTAYVTIMRGCNYSCSYCIVPRVRGRESYRPMAEILTEIRAKVSEGYEEVMLLGQTVNSYYDRVGASEHRSVEETRTSEVPDAPTLRRPDAISEAAVSDFADLLAAVSGISGLERIRFMSPHPRHMKDRVIEAMAASAKVCRHIHLPAQSGSSRLLAQMKRLYTREQYIEIVEKLRTAMPGILVTTDFIVGYPGETEDDFKETLRLMDEVKFEGLFAFKYSPRPGTVAADTPDDVSEVEKDARLQTVLALNKQIQAAARA